MRYLVISLFLLNLLVITKSVAANVKVNKVVGAKEELVLSILQLAINKASPEATVIQLPEEIPVARLVEQTNSGDIDLMWAGSSAELDEKLMAVRIPLLKGLLGHRIFIIRDGDQNRFSHIDNLAQLRELQAGMGHFWGSTKVLKEAGLPVITSVKYKNLFHMLDGSPL